MPKYGKVNTNQSDTDAAYMAGLIDGEGSIIIFEMHRGDKTYYNLQLCVAMTDERTIRWVKDAFGGWFTVKLNGRRGDGSVERMPLYSWGASSGNAADILEKALPYLKCKQEQAEIAIGFQRRVEGCRYAGGRPMPPEEVQWRAEQKRIMKSLSLHGKRAALFGETT